MAPEINLIDPDTYQRDGIPHDQLAWMRAHAPVYWHANGGRDGWPGFWAVTRHQDVAFISRHPEIYSSARRLTIFTEAPEQAIQVQRLMMLNMDPPQHTRQRSFVNRGFTPRMIGRLEQRITRLCRDLIEEVARRETADFVTDIAAPLPLQVICELVELFFLLLTVAGNETTRNAASGGMLALLRHRQQWQRLMADPSLIPAAAEEIVRWVSPVNLFRRTAVRDTELGGQRIAEGDKVVVFYSSANRDEEVFNAPQEFDIGRDPNPHVGYGGGGPHFCLGRHLAALELQVLLRVLAERLPDIALDGEVSRLRSNFINGIKHMPVRLHSAAQRTVA